MRKKVLIASDYYAPHWTGIVKSFVNLIEVLGSRLDFSVVTVQYNKDLPAEEVVGSARVIREPYLLVLSRACYSVKAVFRFWKELARHDIVVINSPCSNILPFALMSWIRGKRFVVFHQGDLILPKGIVNRLIEWIFNVSTLSAMALAAGVSSYTRDYGEHSRVLRYFLYKFTPVLMPVYLAERSTEVPAALDGMSRLKEQGKVVFGFGGRFVEEKGIDVLAKAIPLVMEQLPDAHFVFAGETKINYENTFDRMKPELDRLSSCLTFTGLLKGSDLSWFYHLIDFIVIPSRSECLSIVQVEGCLSGKPSICTDVPGARDVVKSTGFGLIAKTEDPRDLANKLVEAVQRKDELLRNLPALQEKFDIARIGDVAYDFIVG